MTITGISDYEDGKEQILDMVRHRRPAATEDEDGRATTADREAVTLGDSTGSTEALTERRRIRDLLERERPA